MKNILVVDGNASWVRALLSAMGREAEIHALGVRSRIRFGLPQPWVRGGDGIETKPVLVPGWTRFPRLSTGIVRRAVRKAIRDFGIDVLIYTLPFYADVAVEFAGEISQVYYAHDPFRFYEWDVAATNALERRMLQACDISLAISQALAEDLRKISSRPVFYSPNAVSTAFLQKLGSASSVVEESRTLPRPIIGCIGQINSSYDWQMIGEMADGIPEATFAFIGPVFEESADVRRPREIAMTKPNVKLLGPKPHDQLPDYLRGFDICLNPLAINDHNDRRSPLRLYDYLATDRPILSTAIREAAAHEGLIHTFATPAEGVAIARQILAGELPVDLNARWRYIRANTWESRAAQVIGHLDSMQRSRNLE